jgi:hypothetical protein
MQRGHTKVRFMETVFEKLIVATLSNLLAFYWLQRL